MLLFAHMGLALAAASPSRRLNLWFVLLGSMLPDLIDKPLGELVFGTPAMGRTFAHTLLFLLILISLAVYLRDMRIASLCFGVFTHLALDFMWRSPVTLFWPLLGGFPQAEYMDPVSYLQMLLHGLANPVVLIPECLGLVYFLYFLREHWSEAVAQSRKVAGMALQMLFKSP
ncbi:MAG: metal-dependent hydrolase [Methanotrichaceae archaeon]|nr:metal-dependent hydrolase [Methanotrichaceae archaeon]